MCLGKEFRDHGTRACGRGIILIPADAQHTTGVQKLTLNAKESMNGLLGQRGARDQASVPEKTARGRAPGQKRGREGRAGVRLRHGQRVETPGPFLRLGAEAAGLGARIWELENGLRQTSGRNLSPLPLPGCACLEPPPPLSFRRTHRTPRPSFSGSAAEDEERPSASGSLRPLRRPLTSHLGPSAHATLSRLLDLGLANKPKYVL